MVRPSHVWRGRFVSLSMVWFHGWILDICCLWDHTLLPWSSPLVIDHPLHLFHIIFVHWGSLYPHMGDDLVSGTYVEAPIWWFSTLEHIFIHCVYLYWLFYLIMTLSSSTCSIYWYFFLGQPLLIHTWGLIYLLGSYIHAQRLALLAQSFMLEEVHTWYLYYYLTPSFIIDRLCHPHVRNIGGIYLLYWHYFIMESLVWH